MTKVQPPPWPISLIILTLITGCTELPADETPEPTPQLSPFVGGIVSFQPGEGAGFGQDQLPDVVLGPPVGGGERQGSVDVLSLGTGGVLVLELELPALNGDGPDLLVFENAFRSTSSPESTWAEPAEISVSQDGVTWFTYPCSPLAYPWQGCAGKNPVYSAPDNGIDPTDPAVAGGDAFDLALTGLTEVNYIKIHDLTTGGAAPSAGFDLDAIAVIFPRQ